MNSSSSPDVCQDLPEKTDWGALGDLMRKKYPQHFKRIDAHVEDVSKCEQGVHFLPNLNDRDTEAAYFEAFEAQFFPKDQFFSSSEEYSDSDSDSDSDDDDECIIEIQVPKESLSECMDSLEILSSLIDKVLLAQPKNKVSVKYAESDVIIEPLSPDLPLIDLPPPIVDDPPITDTRHRGGVRRRSKKKQGMRRRRKAIGRASIGRAQSRVRVHVPLTGKDLGFDRAYSRDFTTVFPQIVSGNTVPTTGYLTFQFSDVASSANLSSDFEWFRIDRVKVHFQALDTTVINNNSTSAIQTMTPNFAAAVDTNGVGYTPSAISQVLNYANSKYTVATRDLRFSFRPVYNAQTYKSSTQVGYSPGEDMLRTADASEPHYGLLYWMDVPSGANPVAGAYAYNVIVKYYITFAGGK